ncbi:MAG: hypothetical protein MUC94_18010 [bacterium]|jgi:hypothetical protein|nr:hypothetical protein [bacterium]
MKYTETVTIMCPNGAIIHVEKIQEFSLRALLPRELFPRDFLPRGRRTLKQRIATALVRVDPFQHR